MMVNTIMLSYLVHAQVNQTWNGIFSAFIRTLDVKSSMSI